MQLIEKKHKIGPLVERYTLTMQPIGESTLKTCNWFHLCLLEADND